MAFSILTVERRIAVIQAIGEAETENLLSRLRYIRSYMTEEQLKTPALQFFKEHFPNLEIVRNDKYNVHELKWKDDVARGYGCCGLGENMRASVAPSTGGLQFSVDSGYSLQCFLIMLRKSIPGSCSFCCYSDFHALSIRSKIN
jgi:hypothetical protein